jgi:NADH dehydrogenase
MRIAFMESTPGLGRGPILRLGWYWDKGDLAIVGRTYAVADLRFLRFTGFLAWIVWAAVHVYFLIGFANRFFVILQWGVAFLTKRQQVRVFPEQERAAKAP